MAFCSKCGSAVADGVAFCPQCGAPLSAAQAVPPAVIVPAAGSGMQENVAGMLSYILGFITGIIFLLIDKRPFVRFHAAQSIVVFGFLFILRLIFIFGIIGSGFIGMTAVWGMLSLLLSIVTLVAWIALMVFAYQGKLFEVPIAAGIAKKIAKQI
jgi:uncharacterized membrane protein